jgi:hypothetical protein
MLKSKYATIGRAVYYEQTYSGSVDCHHLKKSVEFEIKWDKIRVACGVLRLFVASVLMSASSALVPTKKSSHSFRSTPVACKMPSPRTNSSRVPVESDEATKALLIREGVQPD